MFLIFFKKKEHSLENVFLILFWYARTDLWRFVLWIDYSMFILKNYLHVLEYVIIVLSIYICPYNNEITNESDKEAYYMALLYYINNIVN